jgi:transcriptional regulator with XRE-family HTH domain
VPVVTDVSGHYLPLHIAGVIQLVECQLPKLDVAGSSPVARSDQTRKRRSPSGARRFAFAISVRRERQVRTGKVLHKGIENECRDRQIHRMSENSPVLRTIASTLREARRNRRMSIAELAVSAGVSPRLVSEFEQGKRPNVSLETALRLLALVGVSVRLHDTGPMGDAELARAQRAAQRRSRWTGSLSTLQAQVDPSPPSLATARLGAVANASELATALQRAARSPRQ